MDEDENGDWDVRQLLEIESKLSQHDKDREALLGDTALKFHLVTSLLERYPTESTGFLTEQKKRYESNACMAAYMNYVTSVQSEPLQYSEEKAQVLVKGMSDNAKHKMGTRWEVLYALRVQKFGEEHAKKFCKFWMRFVEGNVVIFPTKFHSTISEDLKLEEGRIPDKENIDFVAIEQLKHTMPVCDHCGVSANRWILLRCSSPKNLCNLCCVEKPVFCGRIWLECAVCNHAQSTYVGQIVYSRSVVHPSLAVKAVGMPADLNRVPNTLKDVCLRSKDNCPSCEKQAMYLFYCSNKYPCKGWSGMTCSNKYKCKKLAAFYCLICDILYSSAADPPKDEFLMNAGFKKMKV